MFFPTIKNICPLGQKKHVSEGELLFKALADYKQLLFKIQ
ncbi:hypothetical protein CLU97_4749 [Chryseobacterium sp. 7]|nr:hypothetical protein CLU97_4749 [Chryseobacterium sp. 7]